MTSSQHCVVVDGRGRSQGIMFRPTWSKPTQKSIKPKWSEHLWCMNMEGAGLMTYTAVSHQMAPPVLTTLSMMSLPGVHWTFTSCWWCYRIFDYRSVICDLFLVCRRVSLIFDQMDVLASVSMHGCLCSCSPTSVLFCRKLPPRCTWWWRWARHHAASLWPLDLPRVGCN